ncbi:MAG: fibronectin type III domain-containing protein [Deltaproteobacteria bacterium]|nr:fibronectin type III domain-containing protein [Deltaproteobacteria bacterium]
MRRLSLLLVIPLLLAACGKKGPLIYPDMLVPEAPSAVTVRQAGVGMRLSFVLPRKDLAEQSLTDLAGVRILKRESMPSPPQDCPACTDSFRLFRTLYVDVQDGSVRRYGSLMVLLDSDVRAAGVYTYRVVPFTKKGVDGAASAPVTATMVPPPIPPVLHIFPSPTDIRLEFVGLLPVIGSLVGYDLYRAVKGEDLPFLPLNKAPLSGSSFTDSGLNRGVTYSYAARLIVRMPTGELVESILSNQVEGALREDE